MAEPQSRSRLVRFGRFEVNVQTGELRKDGMKLKFSGQPFQVLAILLERPGEVVTREELQKRLWPDTFVDVERNLNTAVNKIREALGDSAESPQYVETLPRRGYRFMAPLEDDAVASNRQTAEPLAVPRFRWTRYWVVLVIVLLLATAGLFYRRAFKPNRPQFKRLTRLTLTRACRRLQHSHPTVATSHSVQLRVAALTYGFKQLTDRGLQSGLLRGWVLTGSRSGLLTAAFLPFAQRLTVVGCLSCPQWEAQACNVKWHPSVTSHIGLPTDRSFCSNLVISV